MGEAETYLSQADAVMARLVSEHGACPLREGEVLPFHTLAVSILNQQLSAKAADTIERRVAEIISTPFTPENVLAVTPDALRGAGLSAAKIRYIRELAASVTDGHLDFTELADYSDEDVVAALTRLRGIGRWTADMFLIFGLKRLDVLALGDAGLQRAARLLYPADGDEGVLERVSPAWRPYRSIASWYLWRHLDTAR